MVVSVAKATSTEYYTGGGGIAPGAESYYLDAVTSGEPAGTWSGSGAAKLGLEGEVTAEDMHTAFSEFISPINGEPIGSAPKQHQSVEDRFSAALAAEPGALPERVQEIRTQIERSDRQSVIGWDATFSVAKSVTVAHTAVHRAELAAIRSGDVDRAIEFAAIRSGIESGIDEANTAMLRYAETIAVARAGRHGGHSSTARWEAAPGLAVASFVQHTNRNIDPQYHVHNVMLNRAECADGKWRALDGVDLLAHKHALGAVADRVLEEALTRMGFEFQLRPDGMARELIVVPTGVNDLFSSRSRQITARVAELLPAAEERVGRELTDLELDRLKRVVTKATRATKGSHAPETVGEMVERWNAMVEGEVGSSLDTVADDVRDHLTENLARRESPEYAEPEWSRSAVIAEAVAAVGQQRSAWRPPDLTLEIARRLPSLGGLDAEQTVRILDDLTEQALASPLVRQVSGLLPDDLDSNGTALTGSHRLADALAADPFTRPSARLFATTDTLASEEALRRAGITRGATHLDADQAGQWLDTHAPTNGADQRAAVTGIISSDAELCVLVGPAGTGKSYTAGTLAQVWADLTAGHESGPGRVMGLAVSQIATQVLKDDGVENSRNISQWLDTQDRIASGSTHPGDTAWRLRAADVVMVDEASMVATADLERIHALVQGAGARMVLTGDPRQLGAVEAGGVMGLLDGHAETYTLSDVRRFTSGWEAEASLALRDGDLDALATYDRHGRLTGHDTAQDATDAAARAAVADRLDGRSVVVVTGTNEQAAAIATSVRDQLVELGLVEADGVLLGRDGCTAGVGDLIAARRNDYGLGVTNRAQYRVTATGDDGSLTIVPANREAPAGPNGEGDAGPITLPPSYVGQDVQLGYASTAHAAQGLTVDSAHLVTGGDLDTSGLYVGMTRGRIRNTAHVALNTPPGSPSAPAAATETGGEVRLEADLRQASARSVLEGCLERDTTTRAATIEAELDAERLSSMSVLAGRYEAVVRAACRERLDRDLDQLTADGVLDTDTRAQLGADQSTDHLSRLLRAVEQTGADPRTVLRDAIEVRGLGDADSAAQVLAHRINAGGTLSPAPGADALTPPSGISPHASQYLQLLSGRMTQRQLTLGERTAAESPPWAMTSLGPVPADETARQDWITRAGTVAAHREATGWDHPHHAIGTMPGLSATEKRASYAAAWDALGQPETGLEATAMTEGQLRIRVRAAQLERDWAPPHADAALRAAELAAETARQDAAIARGMAEQATRLGDTEAAAKHTADADAHDELATVKAAAIEPLSAAAQARATWAAAAGVTLDEGARSEAELERRGIIIGQEPDRATTADWLADQRQAQEADDAHRVITEADIHDSSTTAESGNLREPDEAASDDASDVAGPTHDDAPELDQLPETVTAEPGWDGEPAQRWADVDKQTQREQGWGRSLSPAHRVIPEDATAQEIEASAATAALAVAKARDRASQDAAHTSPADLDDADGRSAESDEAGRHHRDSADQHAVISAHEIGAEQDVNVDDA